MEPEQRALNSMSRKEGEFTLLLDEEFDILWHSESLSRILGWSDLRGHNGTEFVHPEDLELVLETMMQVSRGGDHDRPTSDSLTPTACGTRSRRRHGITPTTPM
jgi:PAS domain S-box-containing protein